MSSLRQASIPIHDIPPGLNTLADQLANRVVETGYPLQGAVQLVRTRIAEVAVKSCDGSRVNAQARVHVDQTTLAYALLREPAARVENPTIEDRPGNAACPVCIRGVSILAPTGGDAPWLFGAEGCLLDIEIRILEIRLMARALIVSGGHLGHAAKLLGLRYTTLSHRITRLAHRRPHQGGGASCRARHIEALGLAEQAMARIRVPEDEET